MEPQIANLSPQAQAEMMILLQELMKIGNFELLIRNPEFWKLVRSIKDPDFQSKFSEELINFYKCPTCNVRVRRFPDGDYYCFSCGTGSQPIESLTYEDKNKVNCLKCFKMLNLESFINPCFHLCGYCVYKEMSKGRNCCKICSIALEANSQSMCNNCGGAYLFKDLHELRCSCRYCKTCLHEIKKQKRCLRCQGINLLNSENYTFNTRDFELCMTCETNQKFEEFPSKACCDLDICRTCLSNSECPCS